MNTIGNYENFRTGRLENDQEDSERWKYLSCKTDQKKCRVDDVANHFPVLDNNPLSFIQTDKHFIKDHNDVFNCNVQSYITAIMLETQSVDKGYSINNRMNKSQQVPQCNFNNFNFGQCFQNQLKSYHCKKTGVLIFNYRSCDLI